ncbi:MAG: DUF1934 domain-containing protein [Clostridia bacterium]|nr:DUF1934 domain-containing protein [Clostridia bacterium]
MITDSKKVLVRMNFKNDDIYDFKRVPSEDDAEDYDDEYDEDTVDEPGELDIDGDDTAKNGTNVVTEGYLYKKDGRVVLRYAEADSTDLANELTVLSYELGKPGILTMERNGICRTVMVFEEGKRYISMYSVGAMSMELTIRTYELENTLTLENGGAVRLGYTLENGGSTVSSVKMLINIELL